MTSMLIAGLSGLVMLWAFVMLVRHKLNETNMGLTIYRKLRGAATTGRLLRAVFKEPLLGLEPEAAHLAETRSMMRSYWLTGLYGLIFLVSLFIFAVSTGLIFD